MSLRFLRAAVLRLRIYLRARRIEQLQYEAPNDIFGGGEWFAEIQKLRERNRRDEAKLGEIS